MPTTTITRCGGAANTYPLNVANVAPGFLRGYWRLGESVSPFADTSGFAGGPTDLAWTITGTAWTPHVAGGVLPAQDDGAVQLNQPVRQGYWAVSANSAIWASVINSFSVSAILNPTLSALTWRGGIFSNQTFVGGSPSHEEGWSFEGFWTGASVQARLTRAVNNATVSVAVTIPTGSWSVVVATYDGGTMTIYLNGVVAATQADGRPMASQSNGSPQFGTITTGPPAVTDQFYGIVDELAFWGTVLNSTQVATLYAAS